MLGFDTSGKRKHFSIKQILQRREVFHALQQKNASDDDILKDFSDGLHFKRHTFFSCHTTEELLKLQLYTDEFEITNCLG